MAKIEYQGSCHCGQIQFSFRAEMITEGKRCNCSICKRKGAVMSAVYFAAADFTPSPNEAAKADYRWGDGGLGHLFCKTCGIFPYFGNEEWGYRVNLGCVDQIDTFALKISLIDGKAMPLNRDADQKSNN